MSRLELAKPGDPAPRRRVSILGNLAANFGGQAALAGLSLICIPIYIYLLGMEAFGLISFSVILQALVRVLDLGLTPTVIRETARSTVAGAGELRSLIRTYERLFALLGLAIATALVIASHWIAGHWLQHRHLDPATIRLCVLLMGVQCGVSWLSGFYQSALLGLERQVAFNLLRTTEACFSALGSLGVLYFVAPRVDFMFAWQLLVAGAAAAAYGLVLHARLPASTATPLFRLSHLHRIRGFTAGMAGITVASAALTYMDKLVLSKILPLASLGDYTLAYFAAGTVFAVLVLPFSNVMFPRYSALVAADDDAGLRGLYHLTVQLMAALAVPAAVVLFWFTGDLVLLWTRNPAVAAQTARIVPFLAAGMMCSALQVPAYTLQIAHGRTGAVLKINLVLIVVFTPLLLLLAWRLGTVGAAASYLVMQALDLALMLPITHGRLLQGDPWRSAARDLAPGAILGLLGMAGLRWLPWRALPLILRVVAAGVTWLALAAAMARTSPRIREAWRTRWVALFGPTRA